MADTKLSALSELSIADGADDLYIVDDTGPTSYKIGTDRAGGFFSRGMAGGRLTLTSGTAVTTADVTGATNIYYTPYVNDRIALYDGTRWLLYGFSELTLAVGTLTSGLPYDVFLYDNSGTLTLESLAWTSTTARATAITLTNGVYLKNGALTRRYLGTFYTTSTTQTEDSVAKRFLWNYNNRVQRRLFMNEATASWTYSTASYQQVRAQAANQVEGVVGVAEVSVDLSYAITTRNSTAGAYGQVTIGEDSTTAGDALSTAPFATSAATNAYVSLHARLVKYPAIGYHKWVPLEAGNGTATQTWFGGSGNQASMLGTIWG